MYRLDQSREAQGLLCGLDMFVKVVNSPIQAIAVSEYS
jgi:hypothetical protein